MKAWWVKKLYEERYYCSNCGPDGYYICSCSNPKETGYNFCPCCGAKMGDTTEEEKKPMTVEEAIKEIEDASSEELSRLDTRYEWHKLEIERRIEAFDMAIKALRGEE